MSCKCHKECIRPTDPCPWCKADRLTKEAKLMEYENETLRKRLRDIQHILNNRGKLVSDD